MNALSTVLDIALILISLVLIVSVLMQQGQRQGLGAISGGAETFFGKGKAKSIDAKLAKITKIAAVAFIVLAIVTAIIVAHMDSDTVASSTADEALVEETEATEDAEVADETETTDDAEATETEDAEAAGDAEAAETEDTEATEDAEAADGAEAAPEDAGTDAE